MPAFEYTALDKNGRTHKGILEGDTARQIRQKLRDQNLMPISTEEIAQKSTKRQRTWGRVSAVELALMTRQLATLVRAGTTLEESLQAVAEQTEKSHVKSLLSAVRSRVLEGHSLAQALKDFPSVFNELYRATVAAGEQSGHLDLVLERLAEYTENRQILRQKTLLALFYPALLTGVAVLVVLGLLTYVVPQVVQVFENINQKLPFLTQALIHVSHFLQIWGIGLFLTLILIITGLRYLLRFEKFLLIFHRILLHLPIISRLERGSNVARFTRTLSILTESGVPVLESLEITTQVISNRPMRYAIQKATDKVREGSSLNQALAQSGLFPPITVHLIASGESSGKLEKMLERAAITQEQELETLTSVLLNLFEPLLILVMGCVVLIIVLAILMPIFDLNQLIR